MKPRLPRFISGLCGVRFNGSEGIWVQGNGALTDLTLVEAKRLHSWLTRYLAWEKAQRKGKR